MKIRKLTKDDEAQAVSFLKQHVETSLFLLSNIFQAGMNYNGRFREGEYWASFNDEGHMTNILGHFWNNMVIVQTPTPRGLRELFEHFKAKASRRVGGFMGSASHVEQAMDFCGMEKAPLSMDGNEVLYKLDLDDMTMPSFDPERFTLKHISELDKDIFLRWQTDYSVEALNRKDGDKLREELKNEIDLLYKDNRRWFLEYDGEPVSMVGFNARIPEIVQIGPVWTPVDKRCNGFARIGLALALEQAREREGVKTSILFAENPAAAKAYIAIGYNAIGDYKLALFEEDQSLN